MTSTGVLRTYASGLVAFEHLPTAAAAAEPTDKLLFVGGLGDGLFTVPFVHHLIGIGDGWRVVEVLTSSSYTGWGSGSVKRYNFLERGWGIKVDKKERDAEEIGKAVEYFRGSSMDADGGKIVLMGHSTGSQDAMQYLLNMAAGTAPSVDGVIMQAPVSDREAIVRTTSKTAYLTSLNFCESWIKDGRGKEILPVEMRPSFQDTPVCADRWYSLAAPLDANGKPQGSEDFFSSDLDDETLAGTFGKIPKETPVLALFCGEDQFVAAGLDKEAILRRWKNAAAGENFKTALVPGATHNIGGVSTEVMEDFVGKVKGFLKVVTGGQGD